MIFYGPAGACTVIVLSGFLLHIKENKRKQDKRGTLPDIVLSTAEKERKLISYNVLYKVNLIKQ